MSENELYNEGDCRVTNSQIFSGATSYAISSVTRVVLKRNLGFVPFIFIGLGGLVVIAGFDMAIVAFGLVMIAIGGFIYTLASSTKCNSLLKGIDLEGSKESQLLPRS